MEEEEVQEILVNIMIKSKVYEHVSFVINVAELVTNDSSIS
jgi:hypothetical protein